ncbi:MAG: hypothetical protein KGD63_00330 [Candidatus Lokiarchaeota archaeon]|nr:hypothetical protein [Candidatus Lokiarchaeota archaeon]
MRQGPRTTNTLVKNRYLILYLLIMILGAQPSIWMFWGYWQLLPTESIQFYIFFPFIFVVGIIILLFSSLFISKIFLSLANLMHKPREGVFYRNKKDKDYCYWSIRAIIKKWPIWIGRQISIPCFEIYILKVFGLNIKGKVSLHEGWIDTEFIEIGNNVKLGQGSLILSSMIIQDKLILKKVKIDDNVIIGIHSVILPGTKIKKNTIIDANSSTKINQILETESIYRGSPCKKINKKSIIQNKKIFFEEVIKNEIEPKIKEKDNFQDENKELGIAFHIYIASGWIICGFSFFLPGILFFSYFHGFLEPNLLLISIKLDFFLNIKIILILLTLPLVFIGMYLLHLFFVACNTRFIYKYVKKRGPNQGIFDRNLDNDAKALFYYHFKSFLFKYPIFAFIRSPFPWLINWELRFLGSNKIGKGTIIEETFLHSNVNTGKNCYLGTFSHITNHVVDGVYGEENLTYFETTMGDNVTFEAQTAALPGSIIGNNSGFFPISSTIKYDELRGDSLYTNFPVKKIDKKDIFKILGENLDGK